MKLKLLFIAGLMLACVKSYAQYESAVGLNVGWTQGGVGILGSYDIYLEKNQFLEIGGYFSFSEDQFKGTKIPFNIYTLNLSYFYEFATTKDYQFRFYGGAGALAGYEVVNRGERMLPSGAIIQDDSKFLFGVGLSVDTEWIVDDKISIVLRLTEYYQPSSDLGVFIPYAGLGMRYLLF